MAARGRTIRGSAVDAMRLAGGPKRGKRGERQRRLYGAGRSADKARSSAGSVASSLFRDALRTAEGEHDDGRFQFLRNALHAHREALVDVLGAAQSALDGVDAILRAKQGKHR